MPAPLPVGSYVISTSVYSSMNASLNAPITCSTLVEPPVATEPLRSSAGAAPPSVVFASVSSSSAPAVVVEPAVVLVVLLEAAVVLAESEPQAARLAPMAHTVSNAAIFFNFIVISSPSSIGQTLF